MEVFLSSVCRIFGSEKNPLQESNRKRKAEKQYQNSSNKLAKDIQHGTKTHSYESNKESNKESKESKETDRIALIEEIERLKEEVEYQRQLNNILTVEERLWSDMKKKVRDAAFYTRNEFGAPIPFRCFGVLSPLIEEDLGKTNSILITNQYIRNPRFYPFKVETTSNGEQNAVNWSDPDLVIIENRWGKKVAEDVINAVTELNDRNPSGRYPVYVPWNHTHNREMCASEILELVISEGFVPLKSSLREMLDHHQRLQKSHNELLKQLGIDPTDDYESQDCTIDDRDSDAPTNSDS